MNGRNPARTGSVSDGGSTPPTSTTVCYERTVVGVTGFDGA